MPANLYEELSETVKIFPETDEPEQQYLARLVSGINKLEDPEFDKLSDDAQNWCNDAAIAVEHKTPFQMLPGAPFANGADPEPEPAPKVSRGKGPAKAAAKDAAKSTGKAAAKPTGKGKSTAATPTAGKGKGGSRGAASASKAAAKKTGGGGNRVERAPGVLAFLMEAQFANQTGTAADIQKAVQEKHRGLEVKDANAIGINQQWRRWVKFFHTQGELKNIKLA